MASVVAPLSPKGYQRDRPLLLSIISNGRQRPAPSTPPQGGCRPALYSTHPAAAARDIPESRDIPERLLELLFIE